MSRISQVVRVIINCNARMVREAPTRESLVARITSALPGAVVSLSDETTSLTDLLEKALADNPTLLVACGGDGTINAVASRIVNSSIVLGVLPLGTLNHFSKDLGIPTDLDEAIALLSEAPTCLVDVGKVNERIFLNNAGLGLYPQIVHQRESQQRRGASKWPAAIAATIRSLIRYRRLAVRIVADNESVVRRTPAIMIGNNEYSTDNSLEPTRTSLSQGVLSLYLPRSSGRFKLLWFSLRALLVGVRKAGGFEVMLTKNITIESRRRHLRVSLDGEVTHLDTPLHFESSPKALRVIAPSRKD